MVQDETLQCELVQSQDPVEGRTSTVTCRGRLVNSNSRQLSEVVKPLIQQGGHIVLDLTDLQYVDSAGLGELVALKISAINKGYCTLELINLTPKVKQLLSLTNLTQLFSKQG